MKIIVDNEIKYILGKNAKENFQLIDLAKIENQNYWWFHLDKFPSGHCVVMTENINNEIINIASNFVKENSKVKNMKNIGVIYTQIKNVQKTEILGMVNIKGKRNVIKI